MTKWEEESYVEWQSVTHTNGKEQGTSTAVAEVDVELGGCEKHMLVLHIQHPISIFWWFLDIPLKTITTLLPTGLIECRTSCCALFLVGCSQKTPGGLTISSSWWKWHQKGTGLLLSSCHGNFLKRWSVGTCFSDSGLTLSGCALPWLYQLFTQLPIPFGLHPCYMCC